MKHQELREILNTLGIRLSKSRSQHMLVDENVLTEQMRFANIRDRDTVFEIGAGLGVLTMELAQNAGKVISVENDLRFRPYLEDILPDNVEMIYDDVLDIDMPAFDKVVANIPYKISSKIIFRLLECEFTAGILIFQLEFARRMVAGTGDPDYSRLAVKIHSKAHCEILKRVSKNAFYPQPKVDSAIVELVPREPSYEIADRSFFDKTVDAVFNQRRKKIKNALLNKHRWFGLDKNSFKTVVGDLEVGDLRGQDLGPGELAELSNIILQISRDMKQGSDP
jgi:16S rRNA (adenine1518-N6/adenine1519-N6)-dimethyltransferase